MRLIWVEREIDASADRVWRLLAEPEHWPAWGPTVRAVSVDGERLGLGATGTVRTIAGITLPFEITTFDDGHAWGWNVAGIGATRHRVVALDAERCRAGFGVPWIAAPYVAVCHVALRRIDALAVDD